MRLRRDGAKDVCDAITRGQSSRAWSRFLLAGAAVLTLAGPGCARSFYSRPPERATELGNAFDSLTPSQLGFVRGRTTLDQAMEAMRSRGMTHVTENTNAPQRRDSISVLSADFQFELHVFRNRRYEQSLRLALPATELPQRYALRVADYREGTVIMALVRDAAGFEPTLLVFIPYSEGTAGRPAYMNVSDLERRHGGLQDPLFVGYDLQAGMTFIARDRGGVPWEVGYLLTWDGRTLGRTPVPFSELIMCDCVHTWAHGQDGH